MAPPDVRERLEHVLRTSDVLGVPVEVDYQLIRGVLGLDKETGDVGQAIILLAHAGAVDAVAQVIVLWSRNEDQRWIFLVVGWWVWFWKDDAVEISHR